MGLRVSDRDVKHCLSTCRSNNNQDLQAPSFCLPRTIQTKSERVRRCAASQVRPVHRGIPSNRNTPSLLVPGCYVEENVCDIYNIDSQQADALNLCRVNAKSMTAIQAFGKINSGMMLVEVPLVLTIGVLSVKHSAGITEIKILAASMVSNMGR